jgi:hypothetical protein
MKTFIAHRRIWVTETARVDLRARRGPDGRIEIEVETAADLSSMYARRAVTEAVNEWRRELQGQPMLGQCWASNCRARTARLYCTRHSGWAGFGPAPTEARRGTQKPPGGDGAAREASTVRDGSGKWARRP